MDILTASLNYLKRGLSVIPFRHDKSGACIKWSQYQEVRPCVDDVKGWFTKRFKSEFVAIVTGKLSDLLVIDCDSEEAYKNVQEFIPESMITPTVKSPHGYHIYFKHRDGLINKASYMPNIDVRTEGGCIIAPPSKNGDGLGYSWVSGLSIENVEAQHIPDELYYLLLQYISSSSYKSINRNANSVPENNNCPQMTTSTTNDNKYFTKGRRDNDLFHAANCLARGGCEKEFAAEIIRMIAKKCDPPFNEKEIPLKVESAFQRKQNRDRNLTAEIREWVLTTNGNFLTTSGYNLLHLTTRQEKKHFCVVMQRLKDEGIIEKAGIRDGEWRLIDQDCHPLDWVNADCEYKELWLPLGLDMITGVQPGNILVFAGAKDSGKTAWLMNIAKENRHKYEVHYFNSEMGAAEWKMRASKFDDISIEQFAKGVKLYDRNTNFADVIKPGEGKLNIIDFLEVPDEAWHIGTMIQKIHSKLDGALCVIAIQKKINQDVGRGGEFSMEKARLYISLDYQKAKIISCKNFKENDQIAGNPRGYTCRFKLVQGCRIIKSPQGWTSPTTEQED